MINDCNCNVPSLNDGKFEVKDMIKAPALAMFGGGAIVGCFVLSKFIGKKRKR